MTASERISCLIKGKSIDRMPVIEWAPWWNLTIDKWREQGLDIELESVYDIQNYFNLDKCCQTVFSPTTHCTPIAKTHGAGIMWNEQGYMNIKKSLYPKPETLYPKSYINNLIVTHNAGDTIHFFTVAGFFWFPREMFGIEPHLFSYYDYPNLLKNMCEDYCNWVKSVIEYVGNTFKFDFMSFAEDMSYNNGPMLSKDTFDEFLAPYYKQVIPLLKKLDIPVFIDSDGNITKAVDWYAQVDADGMFPLERQAGVDVSLYISKHPEMTFLGHFDKMCMKFGENAMRNEFERILPSAQKGKVIISVDHQTPPDVSLENYKIYCKLLYEYASKIKH